MPVTTYYFNTSNGGPTDPQSVWTTAANAFDGSLATFATSTTAGTNASNYLEGDGTTAPTSPVAPNSTNITQVRARVYGDKNGAGSNISAEVFDSSLNSLGVATNTLTSTPDWGSYVVLTAPAAGWTWSNIQSLKTKIYLSSGVNGASIARVEVEVTSPSLPFDYYKRQGFQ